MPNAILFIAGMLMSACTITAWCCCYVGATHDEV